MAKRQTKPNALRRVSPFLTESALARIMVAAMAATACLGSADKVNASGSVAPSTIAPTRLSMMMQPSPSAQSGARFAQQPLIQLRDASDLPVNESGVVVTASIASGGGTLGGTLTATTDASGVAGFKDLSIAGAGGGRTL